MNSGDLLKLVYISKRMKIGVYESVFYEIVSNPNPEELEIFEIQDFMREEGKHTMMTVKRLDERGMQMPINGGRIAEKFGENIGKAVSVFGWRGTCFLMQIGEGVETLILKVVSSTCRDMTIRETLNLIIFDEQKHSTWWRDKLFRRRNH